MSFQIHIEIYKYSSPQLKIFKKRLDTLWQTVHFLLTDLLWQSSQIDRWPHSQAMLIVLFLQISQTSPLDALEQYTFFYLKNYRSSFLIILNFPRYLSTKLFKGQKMAKQLITPMAKQATTCLKTQKVIFLTQKSSNLFTFKPTPKPVRKFGYKMNLFSVML